MLSNVDPVVMEWQAGAGKHGLESQPSAAIRPRCAVPGSGAMPLGTR